MSRKTGRLPDNLPKFIVHKLPVIPEAVKEKTRLYARILGRVVPPANETPAT